MLEIETKSLEFARAVKGQIPFLGHIGKTRQPKRRETLTDRGADQLIETAIGDLGHRQLLPVQIEGAEPLGHSNPGQVVVGDRIGFSPVQIGDEKFPIGQFVACLE